MRICKGFITLLILDHKNLLILWALKHTVVYLTWFSDFFGVIYQYVDTLTYGSTALCLLWCQITCVKMSQTHNRMTPHIVINDSRLMLTRWPWPILSAGCGAGYPGNVITRDATRWRRQGSIILPECPSGIYPTVVGLSPAASSSSSSDDRERDVISMLINAYLSQRLVVY